MEISHAASSSSLASSRVQQNNDFVGHQDDSINSDMSKSTWMLVGEDFNTEPEKSELDRTQEMPEVDTNDTQSRAQTPEPVSDFLEQDYATDSESETSDAESSSDSEDLTDRSTLLPTEWFGIQGWPGMILNFVLYSPLRNLLSQTINYFRPKPTRSRITRPKTIHELAYPHSNRSRPIDCRACGIKSSRACYKCPICGHYRRPFYTCSRGCVCPSRTPSRPVTYPDPDSFPIPTPYRKPSPNRQAVLCSATGKYVFKGKRCVCGSAHEHD